MVEASRNMGKPSAALAIAEIVVDLAKKQIIDCERCTWKVLEGIKNLHFVGIGGVGMSAIAEVMLDKGYEISGSDLSESAVVKHLKAKGATIYKGHDALNVEGKEALVLSSAIHQDNPELVAAKAKGLKLFHRSDILAYLLMMLKV